jgi:uroporphyrinogen-III decarboxylase
MNGRERILAMIEGKPVDRLPFMPITMMFASDVLGVPYRQYATDFHTLAEAQIQTARMFDFDYVSCISDPAREAADLGATVEFFENQPPAIVESQALLAEKSRLSGLRLPDLSRPGRMKDRIEAARLLKDRIGREKLVEGWVEKGLAPWLPTCAGSIT